MIAIVDYGAGNVTSVRNAMKYLGLEASITSDPRELLRADRIVFPGVGAAGSAMQNLHSTGLGEALREAVDKGKPVLGICLGCQVILSHSEEDDGTTCLDLLAGQVVRFQSAPGVKIPHMGWSQVCFDESTAHPILAGIPSGSHFYFVHSYHPAADLDCALARTLYAGVDFPSVLGRGNLVATQFHAEKSGTVGLTILRNFSTWEGSV